MADGHILKVLGCIEEAILIPPTESGAVALAKDAHATITALLAEIARLRALGLEACSLVDAALCNAPGHTGDDADESAMAAGHAAAERIRKELTR